MDQGSATNGWRSETRAVHEGVYIDGQWNSVTTPIYPSSTFYFDGLNQPPTFDYSRSGNPTRQALVDNLVALEGGAGGIATSSGMSAIATTLMLLSAGDHIIAGHEIYGGSHRLFSQLLPRLGLSFSFVDLTDASALEQAFCSETKLVWLETPTNPLLNIIDIARVVEAARKRDVLTAIDNTFLTPLLQRPLDFGVDVAVQATTKYLNGHSDVVGGVAIARTPELAERLQWLANALGTSCSPFDAWLVLRGVKTLPARLQAHERNALQLAQYLKTRPEVSRVLYPGLPEHPGHALAQRQQSGFGGMLSFEVDVARVDLGRFFRALKLFHLGVSLGGVESLIEQPWSMSHLAMPVDAKRDAGITEGLVRVSAGIEHPDDLIADLGAGLAAAGIN
ncbi:MAG: trans-sulfuration enzyme family protein [Opitutales bacterium]